MKSKKKENGMCEVLVGSGIPDIAEKSSRARQYKANAG
jgi:hypothetical protein